MTSVGESYTDTVVAAARALATGEVDTHGALMYAHNASLDQITSLYIHVSSSNTIGGHVTHSVETVKRIQPRVQA